MKKIFLATACAALALTATTVHAEKLTNMTCSGRLTYDDELTVSKGLDPDRGDHVGPPIGIGECHFGSNGVKKKITRVCDDDYNCTVHARTRAVFSDYDGKYVPVITHVYRVKRR